MKLRSTSKQDFRVQEKAKPPDNAVAYPGVLTHYCAERRSFEALLPCQSSASEAVFVLLLSSMHQTVTVTITTAPPTSDRADGYSFAKIATHTGFKSGYAAESNAHASGGQFSDANASRIYGLPS